MKILFGSVKIFSSRGKIELYPLSVRREGSSVTQGGKESAVMVSVCFCCQRTKQLFNSEGHSLLIQSLSSCSLRKGE